MIDNNVLPLFYMLAAAGFIMAIKWMNSPATARITLPVVVPVTPFVGRDLRHHQMDLPILRESASG